MPNIYRNQTSALSQIQMLSRIRITTAQEAVAYLRAIQPLNEQVAHVLQRASVNAVYQNQPQPTAPEPVKEPEPAPVVNNQFEPTNFGNEMSEEEIKTNTAKFLEKIKRVQKARAEKAKKAEETEAAEEAKTE